MPRLADSECTLQDSGCRVHISRASVRSRCEARGFESDMQGSEGGIAGFERGSCVVRTWYCTWSSSWKFRAATTCAPRCQYTPKSNTSNRNM
eukprot:1775026-Rhodomonas_salina.1